ncbi:helix-turn-helix domain-containing protein [Streptomyces sp. NPDC051684]|uniref:helix-turn-helix domain-containing protein n=1 Tax=Streptomyces sp. NPDC051684 TaxID=3365670 RepID=UPI003791E378
MRPNGTRIRARRTECELSLRALEAQTGIHRSYLSRLETGHIQRPDPERLRAVALALGVDTDAITHQGDDDVPTKDTTDDRAKEQTEQLRRWTPQQVIDLQLLPYTSARVLKEKCYRRELWHHRDGGRITFTAEDLRRNGEQAAVAPAA